MKSLRKTYQKVYVKPKETFQPQPLKMDESLPPSELTDWNDDDVTNGWNDDVIDEEEMMREEREGRMMERLIRHQERKEKRNQVQVGGSKVSKLASKSQ